jgi:hypothetical protein
MRNDISNVILEALVKHSVRLVKNQIIDPINFLVLPQSTSYYA